MKKLFITRMLAIFLTFALILACIPFSVMATEPDPVEEETEEWDFDHPTGHIEPEIRDAARKEVRVD